MTREASPKPAPSQFSKPVMPSSSSRNRIPARAPRAATAETPLEFQNRQRDRRLNLPRLRRIIRCLLDEMLPSVRYELCFHFVSPLEMSRINWQFLRHKGSTDVITFDHHEPTGSGGHPSENLHGEAFICVADAVRQAREFNTTWPSELVRYVVHALLHLRGYDDLQPAARRVLKREENRLVSQLAGRFDFAALEREAARSGRGDRT